MEIDQDLCFAKLYDAHVLDKRHQIQNNILAILTHDYVSFAFTHTYTLEKLTLLLFFPKRTWKILKNVQNAKEKNISLSHVICGSSPSFFVPFPYVILDIPILQTG